MKSIQICKFLVLALAATVAVSGCKKTPVKVTDINGPPLEGQKVPGGPGSDLNGSRPRTNPNRVPFDLTPAPPISTSPGTSGNPLPNSSGNLNGTGSDTNLANSNPTNTGPVVIPGPEGFAGYSEHPEVLKDDSVYFDFDSSAVRATEKTKVPPVAEYLKEHATEKVRIAGNCDERGTEEYNRSLGDRRALALREELLRLGVDPLRIDTVTYGKDKPVAVGHDESAWRQNRRGDFIVLFPPAAP